MTRGEIVGIRQYSGDPTVKIEDNVAAEVVQLLEESKQTTTGYAIDLGVLDSGQTALVEWNDGFSLGSYGLDKSIYTDLLIARWCEIVGD